MLWMDFQEIGEWVL